MPVPAFAPLADSEMAPPGMAIQSGTGTLAAFEAVVPRKPPGKDFPLLGGTGFGAIGVVAKRLFLNWTALDVVRFLECHCVGIIKVLRGNDVEPLQNLGIVIRGRNKMAHLIFVEEEELALFPASDQQIGAGYEHRAGRANIVVRVIEIWKVVGKEPVQNSEFWIELDHAISEQRAIRSRRWLRWRSISRHNIDVAIVISRWSLPCLPDASLFAICSCVKDSDRLQRLRIVGKYPAVIGIGILVARECDVDGIV